jgi:Kef-type K+ transport system membrane component KefB
MTAVWALASLWLGLALIASLLAIWLRISSALSEIVVGTIAQLIIGAAVGSSLLGTDESWIEFLSGIGAIVLTFLAGAELDPAVFRLKWKEAVAIGLISFLFPFLGCAAAAHYLLGWEVMPSWLAGVAMSTTSVAVVYAVMIEFGFNTTEYGKTVLAACFITDLGTVVAFVSIPALIAAPGAFVFFLIVKIATKIVGVYPVTKFFGSPSKEGMYTTLLMSTGLTFGTISSLFGLSHGIIDQSQYSALVATVIGSAVIPTVIANAFYLPRHLIPRSEPHEPRDVMAQLPKPSGAGD